MLHVRTSAISQILKKNLVAVLALLVIGCGGLGPVQSHYERGNYYLFARPTSPDSLQEFQAAAATGEKLLLENRYRQLEHDPVVFLVAASYIGAGGYFKNQNDVLAEEDMYLKAIATTSKMGQQLPYPPGQIYQNIQSVYRKEQVKRHCYFVLSDMYSRIDEPELAAIVRLQWQFSNQYLLSAFFAQERRVVQEYEFQSQVQQDSLFQNDVFTGALMAMATIIYLVREAAIAAGHSQGHMSTPEAYYHSQHAKTDYASTMQALEQAHTDIESTIRHKFEAYVLTPLFQNTTDLHQFPLLEKLDSYQRLCTITQELKKASKNRFSPELIRLLGKYESQLLAMYQETRRLRSGKIGDMRHQPKAN